MRILPHQGRSARSRRKNRNLSGYDRDNSSAGEEEPKQRDAKTSRPPQRQGYPHADRGGVSVGPADVQKVRSKESADSPCSFYGRRWRSRMAPWLDTVPRHVFI